jgi:predicted dehydrogenase
MMRLVLVFLTAAAAASPQPPTIAVIGLRHSHVWGHIGKMIEGKPAKLVGVAESIPSLVDEATRRGVPASAVFKDYKTMLDERKPALVWAFVENNRHLEIVEACAPRKIHVIFEKPLAASLRDAQNIRRLSLQHGIYVMTNYQMAWWPSQLAAKGAIDAGVIGKVWRLRGVVGHGGPGKAAGLNEVFFRWLTDPERRAPGHWWISAVTTLSGVCCI